MNVKMWLQVEGYSAIVEVGENWFGYIVSWTDGKKKSNLMLSLWPPGWKTLICA